jgi:serine/threonine-protein kinase
VTDEFVGVVRFLGGNACLVPNVKGRLLTAAKRAIRKAGCSPGTVNRRFSVTVKKGRVVLQKPHPGARVAARTKISLVVSKGRRPV